ncbi:hypothetical protein P3S67_005654 [Capsicum chacoense]
MTICGIDPPIILVERNHPSSISGNIRGRYQCGRGSAFRNDGVRGRGNYGGGGRGYNRGDFNRISEFNNRGGNRGGSSHCCLFCFYYLSLLLSLLYTSSYYPAFHRLGLLNDLYEVGSKGGSILRWK